MNSPASSIPDTAAGEPIEGQMVLRILAAFEAHGLRYVYLRNFEALPHSVGHDVDILVDRGKRGEAVRLIRETTRTCRWKYLGYVEFSPYALFLASPDGAKVLHLDIFDRIEWHGCEFADASLVLDRRVHSGLVYRPDIADEVYMNLCDRWIYLAEVREKHRAQFQAAMGEVGEARLASAFADHLGARHGARIFAVPAAGAWEKVGESTRALRKAAILRYGLNRPASLLAGMVRYGRRSITRILRPPGPFIVFLGADGVGKSAVIERTLGLLEEMTGVRNPLLFHWKPRRASIRVAGAPAPSAQNPRGRPPRSPLGSLAFLAYHWLGFWVGWFRWLRPRLVGSRGVIGDRYAVDMFLDPRRFRLAVPDPLLGLASRTVPQPDLVVGLIADPQTISTRKAELSAEEISSYQHRLQGLPARHASVRIVDANGTLSEVCSEVRLAILSWAEQRAGGRNSVCDVPAPNG